MKFKVVALAASTGGPQALTYIFRHLPVHLPAAYLIVQHLPPSFTRYFADGLAKKNKYRSTSSNRWAASSTRTGLDSTFRSPFDGSISCIKAWLVRVA